MTGREYSEQGQWTELTVSRRCRVIASVAAKIAEASDALTTACASDQRVDPVETISAELLPMCSALRRIGKKGPRILADQRHGAIGRPLWLWGVASVVRRVPRGDVLILGTWNYPLLLMGVQAAQALAAGNRVLLKPAPGCEAVSSQMVQCFYDAGVPPSQLILLESTTEAAVEAIQSGVDLIVLTGAASTGRKVLSSVAESLTPTIMELSGCDAVVLTPSADLPRAVASIRFGLNFNSGATCIGPRRLIAMPEQADQLIELLGDQLRSDPLIQVHPAARDGFVNVIEQGIAAGAKDVLGHFDPDSIRRHGQTKPILLDQVGPENPVAAADVFAPVTSVIRVNESRGAIGIVNGCHYRLAASVFGDRVEATEIAQQLDVGSVAVNDVLVPTADPRLPFGGRGQSGFGVTRGDEGLLAMTVPQVVSVRRGRVMPHLRPRRPGDRETLLGALQLLHGGSIGSRWRGLRRILHAGRKGGSEPVDETTR